MTLRKTSVKDIVVSKYELEGVRKAPGMYVGGLDDAALAIVIKEPIDNVDDQMAGGHAKKCVVVRLGPGHYAVMDDGEGIPVDIHPDTKTSGLTVVLTKLHAGTKSTAATKTQLRGVHGVGVSVTNALSQRFEAYTNRQGWHHQAFEAGRVVSKVVKAKPPVWAAALPAAHRPKKGTIIEFQPDKSLFKDTTFSDDAFLNMLRFNAYLRPKTTWVYLVKNKKTWTEHVFKFNEGLPNLLEDTLKQQEAQPHGKPFFYTSKGLTLIAQWTTGEGAVLSFCNGSPTPSHGTHVKAALAALRASLPSKVKLQNDDVCNGLILLVNASVLRPVFNSQTKQELKTEIPKSEISDLTSAWTRHWSSNKTHAKEIARQAAAHAKVRADFKAAKAATRALASDRKILGRVSNPNFRPAQCRDLSKCTLYIVEGKSAGSPAAGARDPHYHSLLMLRGKIINCHGKSASKALKNEEVSLLLSVLRYDGSPDWHLRSYKEVVILADADQDGGHITLLLLSFFLKYAPQFLTEGRLHRITDASLYKAYHKGQYVFGRTLDDVRKATSASAQIQRIKGWGEIDAKALKFIAFSPETRKLFRINPTSRANVRTIVKLLSASPESVAFRRSLLGLTQSDAGDRDDAAGGGDL